MLSECFIRMEGKSIMGANDRVLTIWKQTNIMCDTRFGTWVRSKLHRIRHALPVPPYTYTKRVWSFLGCFRKDNCENARGRLGRRLESMCYRSLVHCFSIKIALVHLSFCRSTWLLDQQLQVWTCLHQHARMIFTGFHKVKLFKYPLSSSSSFCEYPGCCQEWRDLDFLLYGSFWSSHSIKDT